MEGKYSPISNFKPNFEVKPGVRNFIKSGSLKIGV